MGKPKPPPPPDPAATAQAQTQSNEATARLNAILNRVNQNTPYGNVNYTHNGDQWTQTVTESENQRRLRESNEQLGIGMGELGQSQLGRVSDILGTPYDPRRIDLRDSTGGPLRINQALGSAFKSGQYDPNARLGNFGDDVRARSFALATQGLEPQFARSEEALRDRLANQGINAGTDAFKSEMEGFNTGKGNAYADALLRADTNATAQRGQAANELGQGFNQALAGRGQQLSEMLTQRGTNMSEALQQYGLDTTADQAARSNPLNEIISLMNGTQTTPINPGQAALTNVANTDVAGINGMAWNAANQNYQTQQGGWNSMMGGLAGLGGAWLGGRG